MPKFVHAATAATALLLFASPAAADPFQSFLKACMSTNGDATAAIAAMSALGWKSMPLEAFGEAPPAEMSNVALHINFDPQGDSLPDSIEMLMTGDADAEMLLDAPTVSMEVCGIIAIEGDAAALVQQATAYFGAPPQMDEEDTAWIYSRQNGRIVLEDELVHAEDDVILAALQDRPLFAVFSFEEDGAAGLMMGAFRSTKVEAR